LGCSHRLVCVGLRSVQGGSERPNLPNANSTIVGDAR
jgi:hypothetical protein